MISWGKSINSLAKIESEKTRIMNIRYDKR